MLLRSKANIKPTARAIQVWPEGASEQLQDCFSCIDWTIFEDDNTVFQSGDTTSYSDARKNLKKGIRDAETAFKRRIEDHFGNSDPYWTWHEIRHITRQSNTSSLTSGSAVEAEQLLNLFVGHFEVDRTRTNMDPAPVTNNQALIIQSEDVIRTHVLRDCAAARYFQMSSLSVTVHSSHLPDDIHNSASSKADCYNIPQRLQARHHEMPGEAGCATHQGCSATHPGPSPIHIQSHQVNERRHLHCPPH